MSVHIAPWGGAESSWPWQSKLERVLVFTETSDTVSEYVRPVSGRRPSQHTATAHRHSTPSQHTATAHHHSTPSQHTATAHRHSTPP